MLKHHYSMYDGIKNFHTVRDGLSKTTTRINKTLSVYVCKIHIKYEKKIINFWHHDVSNSY